jgi:PAS domain S-box-containing protein
MKVLVRRLEAELRLLSRSTITAIALVWVLALGVADYYTSGSMSFVLFYMLAVVFAGWGAGKWPAWSISWAALVTMVTVHLVMHRAVATPFWIALWNYSTRFVVFSITGWLAAEIRSLTRCLEDRVEQQTSRLKREMEAHKATSRSLSESLERFEQVINNITEVFWLADLAKTQMVYISPGYEHIWGRKCQELYREPRSWLAAVHPDDRDTVSRRSFNEQAAGGYDAEYRIVRPDGAVRWIRDRAFPVRNGQGGVYRIAGIAEDITERKKTQETLQTQAAILENMAEGVVVTDEQGLIVQMNPAAERIWGYGRNEVFGQPASVFSALPEPEANAVLREVLEALKASETWRGTFKNQRKDGAIISCEAVINRVEIQGRVFMVAVEQDVTELREANDKLEQRVRERTAELQSANAILQAINQGTDDLICVKDTRGKIIMANPAMSRFLGKAESEIIGTDDLDSLPNPQQAARIRENDQRIMATGRSETVEEVIDQPGRRWHCLFTKSPYRDANGNVIGVIGIGVDITERKRMDQELREAHDKLEQRVQERTAELRAANTALSENEERYRSLVNNLNVGVYRNTLERGGRFIQANPALARIHGYESVKDFEKVSVTELYQDPRERETFLADLLRDGTVCNYGLRLKKNDGTPIYGAVNAAVHRGPDGKVDWIDGMLVDVTERKQAEALLQAQRDLGVSLSLTSNLPTALKHLLNVTMQIGAVDSGGVYLLNGVTRGMDAVVHRGFSAAFVEAVSHWAADSPQMRLMQRGKPFFGIYGGLAIPTDKARLSEGLQSVALIPLSQDGRTIGALALSSHATQEIPRQTQLVLETLATQAAGAIARIRAEAEQHRLERQLLEITDREQARIGQDIHDGLCQHLVTLAFDANSLARELSSQRRAEAPTACRMADLADQAITETRQLARGLFPVRLESEGLPSALEELARTTRERFKIHCRFRSQGTATVPSSTIATHLYRIAQEAVANAVKHSQARRIFIGLTTQDDQLRLKVEDDGRGLHPKKPKDTDGMGLHIMDYRARSFGGTLRVAARPRGGTQVFCCVPRPLR